MHGRRTTAIALIVLGGALFVLAVVAVLGRQSIEPAEEQVATTTPPSLFDMEPIVPEAKVSTEGWKTCRNEEYGWEVKYPEDWYVYGEGHAKVSPSLDLDNEDGGEVEADVWGSVYAYETPCVGGDVRIASWAPGTEYVETLRSGRRITIRADQELFSTYRAEYTNVRDFARSQKELNLRGFYMIDDEESVWLITGDVAVVWMSHLNQRFMVTGLERDAELLETILSTFRFLDTASSTTSATPSV